jgi:hypothetical protein
MKSSTDLTRRVIRYDSGRRREEYFLLASSCLSTILGVRVPLGSRRDLITLRNKINKYLNEP